MNILRAITTNLLSTLLSPLLRYEAVSRRIELYRDKPDLYREEMA